jgi:hypothetical protein
MDRSARMAAFTKVVGDGSFSAAAREMQVSQALVTKQIRGELAWGAAAQPRDAAFESHRRRKFVLRTCCANPRGRRRG